MANDKSSSLLSNPVAVPIDAFVFCCPEGPRFRRAVAENA